MRIIRYIQLLCFLVFLSGCSQGSEEEIHLIDVDDIETVVIEHGSTMVTVESTNELELSASLEPYDGGPSIDITKNKGKVSLALKSNVFRLINIGKMPKLVVHVPENYEGKLQIEGGSGKVEVYNASNYELAVTNKSGKVDLHFLQVKNDIKAITTSGNITFTLGDDQPSIQWLLQSKSGRRIVNRPIEERQEKKMKTTGLLGKGEYNVELQTSSGNIRVH